MQYTQFLEGLAGFVNSFRSFDKSACTVGDAAAFCSLHNVRVGEITLTVDGPVLAGNASATTEPAAPSASGSTNSASVPSAELAAPSPQGSVRIVGREEYADSVLYAPTIAHVAQFHEAFGHPVRTTPTVADGPTRELRAKLMLEELLEFCEAAGVRVTVVPEQRDDRWIHGFEVTHTAAEPDLVEMADALADIDYLAAGSALVFGLPHCEIIEEVQRANMSKLGADGKPVYRADGKIMKGPNYAPPDVTSIVEGHLHASSQEAE